MIMKTSYLGISPIFGARVFRQAHPSFHGFAEKNILKSKKFSNKTLFNTAIAV